MKKVGKVLNIEKNKVFIVTSDNEFCVLRRNSIKPVKGHIYVGELYSKISFLKKVIISLVFVSILFLSIQGFRFFKVSSSFIIDINSSFKLTVNDLGIITNIEGNNSKGREVLKNLDLKYTSLDKCLCCLLKSTIEKKYFTNTHEDNTITIFILKGSEKDILQLKEFETLYKNLDLTLNTNNYGNGTIR